MSCTKQSEKVVAKSGGIRIMSTDFEKELQNAPPSYQNYLTTLEGKKQFLEILLREKILMNQAEKSGLLRRADIQKSIRDFKKRMQDQETEFRKGILLREYLRQLQDSELKVSEDDLKKYYDDNKVEFEKPVKVLASHILSSSESDAQDALNRIKKGEDFAKAAQELSKDPSAIRGGLIGEVSKGDLSELPEFEQALFDLKTGQVSGIVKTKIGYHIIKKNKEMLLPAQSLEKATPQIRRILEKNKFDGWVEKIKSKQKVWIDDKALAAISTPASESVTSGRQATSGTSVASDQ